MTDREREDVKHVAQIGLALIGAAIILGSAIGACYGAARDVIGCWCCEEA